MMEHLIHILHLEDDPADVELVQAIIESAGLTCLIHQVQTCDEFVRALKQGGYDIILADFRLPTYDGMSALRLAQELCHDVPFIFVSGTMGEDAAIAGLTEGATDYVLKQKLSRLGPAIRRALQETENLHERKRAEKDLQKANNLLHAIIEAAPTAIIGLDLEGNVQMVWNPAAEKMLGWSADEAIGRPLPSVPEAGQEEFARFREMIRSGKTLDGKEVHRQKRDGSSIEYSIYASPLRDVEGKIIGNVAVLVDITERKLAEKERERLITQVRDQAQELWQILATVPEGVLLLDHEARVIQANPVAEKDLVTLAGVKVGDILAQLGDRSLAELLTSPPTRGLWHEVRAAQRIFEVIARPMNNSPESEHWVLVINDVTRAREIRDQLRRQEQMAVVGQLAAGIAHDFNNIMATIVLYAQMTVRDGDLPTHLQERMTVINQQAKHATQLIQQILDFSRKSVFERQPLDLLPLLKEQCKLLKRTLPENIEIGLECARDDYIINADLTRMQQVIMNLAVNARDAMPAGGKLLLTLSRMTRKEENKGAVYDEASEKEWVCLTVTDTGSGIPADVLPHIFEPFFTTKPPGLGTGLGLSQVYGIIESHGGRINVSTTVGEGTAFIIYLPALPTQATAMPLLRTQILISGDGETILLVEDDANLRKALVDTLRLLGYQVREATNGREALDILQQTVQEIDLVLSDLVMPELGGQALFYAIQQQGLVVPMILLSGHPVEDELQNMQTQGLAGWMSKPLDMAQLSRLLAQVLGKGAASPLAFPESE